MRVTRILTFDSIVCVKAIVNIC